MIDDGCRTEGCNLTSLQKAIDAQKLKKLQQESYDRKCAAGNTAYCSGDPVEIIAFTGTMLVGGAALEAFILGSGAAGLTDAALYRAGVACLQSAVCRALFGMAGGVEAGSLTGELPKPVYDQASDQHVFPRHIDLLQFLRKSKFLPGEGGQAFADEVFDMATKVEYQSDGFVRIYADLGRVVGTRGETWGRIVINSVTGWVRTQFPQFPFGQ